MATEAIVAIKQAEAQADALLLKAKEEAKQIIEEAMQTCEEQKEAALLNAKAEAKDYAKQTETQIKEIIEQGNQRAAQKEKELKEASLSKVDTGIELVINRLVL